MYMAYYCNTAQTNAQKAGNGQGSAVVHISAAALSSILLMAPSLPERTAIAAVLSDMDTELLSFAARREKACALDQATVQELLTGRTRFI